jgi:hypothetical protein
VPLEVHLTTGFGVAHINSGAKKVAYQRKKTSKQGFAGIAAVVGSYGECP